ncbi:MAG: N-6 DNA methylase [Betaproteobacteria bacterium]|nr:N-6 DNA methylase [Betaproteobacteria bacterium]
MQLSWEMIQSNALAFSKRWKDGADEKSEGPSFVRDFLAVFGVEDAAAVGRFEERAQRMSGRGFMDYFWPQQLGIEMKSRGKDLEDALEQLKDYAIHLPADEMPGLLMVCDFERILLYRRSTADRKEFRTKDLHRHVRKFAILAGYENTREIETQQEVNVAAALKMAKLHDALKSHGYEGHDLEVYLVRLLFCLFADDTGIFPQQAFLNYVENSKKDGSDLSERIARLFEVLNLPDAVRVKKTLLSAELKQFRYINGRLFKDSLPFAEFNEKMRNTLLECCHFDWSAISPAIFGAMFQGVMDKDQRRELGAHYTSEENILKLINPLFMDDLWKEFNRVKTDPVALSRFHEKIARLKFLDPACGCGNFLIITYRELRRLELDLLKMKMKSSHQKLLDIESMLKVSVEQFYGIEIEDFPCQVATVGMWLMDHQMNQRVAEEFGQYFARLPLTQSATIVHGNALRTDWESVVAKEELGFVLGNPPFVGYSNQNEEQKEDILSVYLDASGKPFRNAGKIDYVAAWYYKAARLLMGTQIRAAFVSTNSIMQGEQVSAVWKPVFEMFGTHIDFGYRTFKWSNEAKGKAAVHCVIVGFSHAPLANRGLRMIYDSDGTKNSAKNINPYLVDAPNVFVESRTKPLCDMPELVYGNKPVDGGNLFLNASEYEEFIEQEPAAKKYLKRVYGSEEFINNIERYCLWLVQANPVDLRKLPLVMERIEKVRQFRKSSSKKQTQEGAITPSLFMEIRQPKKNYIIIPRVSSERRRYIPIGFLTANIIVTDLVSIIPNANLYHFGVLTSNVHMAWTNVVCGRLKSDYRYSNKIVYNNFPWPDTNTEQKAAIEELAQAVLDARARYPENSLADLYDPLTMPQELLKAHQNLDRAVMKLYGLPKDTPESAIVALLMEWYQQLTSPQQSFDEEFSSPRKTPKRPRKLRAGSYH